MPSTATRPRSTLTPEERAHLTEGDSTGEIAPAHAGANGSGYSRYRTTWGMLLGFFGAIYILWIYAPGCRPTSRWSGT